MKGEVCRNVWLLPQRRDVSISEKVTEARILASWGVVLKMTNLDSVS